MISRLTPELVALGICEDDLPEPMTIEEGIARIRAFSAAARASSSRHLTDAEIREEAELGWRRVDQDTPIPVRQ
jgi:hypothetical protein